MPPSPHPRPEDLSALVDVLTVTGDHCAGAGDDLLRHMATVGDHTTQAALETLVDHAVDAVRELSATYRELTLSLNSDAAPASSRSVRDTPAASEQR